MTDSTFKLSEEQQIFFDKVVNDAYVFNVWATPRQTGKTTCLHKLAIHLNSIGYKVLWIGYNYDIFVNIFRRTPGNNIKFLKFINNYSLTAYESVLKQYDIVIVDDAEFVEKYKDNNMSNNTCNSIMSLLEYSLKNMFSPVKFILTCGNESNAILDYFNAAFIKKTDSVFHYDKIALSTSTNTGKLKLLHQFTKDIQLILKETITADIPYYMQNLQYVAVNKWVSDGYITELNIFGKDIEIKEFAEDIRTLLGNNDMSNKIMLVYKELCDNLWDVKNGQEIISKMKKVLFDAILYYGSNQRK